MRTKTILFITALLGSSIIASRVDAHLEVAAGFEVTASTDFYEPLGGYGSWVEVGTYGRCWRPTSVVVGWRPYCAGYWTWTDCGWYWSATSRGRGPVIITAGGS